MLTERYNAEKVTRLLLPGSEWRPYPKATQRSPWQQLPQAARERRIHAGEGRLDFAWPTLPATVLLDFARNGDRARFEQLSFARRRAFVDLVLAECVEGEGRFVDAIIDGIWAICEETYWGVPAHLHPQAAGIGLPDAAEPTVDLFAAETASHLAWAHYLLGEQLDAVSPLLRARILHEQRRRLLDPCLQRDDFHWMGLGSQSHRRVNNWNPWICSNWLTTALLLEQDEALRAAHVMKAMRCLDRFIDPYPVDGGCDEGPSYWGRAGASLFDCLELLHSSTAGGIDLFDEPLIGAIGRFLHGVHIDGDYYVNFADAPAIVSPDAALVFRFGQAIADADMIAMGAWLARGEAGHGGVADSSGRALRRLFSEADLQAASGKAPQLRDVWLPDIQVMVARDNPDSAQGFFVAAKGGHNDESHNHNDIGHFTLSIDGLPVIVDAGVETYTKRTFSAQRYDIWTMQSAYHSLPTIGGVQQLPGGTHAARDVEYHADDQAAELKLDIAGAYPAGVLTCWTRLLRLDRGAALILVDEFELGDQGSGPLELNLITACGVLDAGNGRIHLVSRDLGYGVAGTAQLLWNIPGADLSIDRLDLEDKRLRSAWGEALFRLRFTVDEPPRSGRWQLRFERE